MNILQKLLSMCLLILNIEHPRMNYFCLSLFYTALTLTSSGQITSLKFNKSSESGNSVLHVLGRFSSFISVKKQIKMRRNTSINLFHYAINSKLHLNYNILHLCCFIMTKDWIGQSYFKVKIVISPLYLLTFVSIDNSL